MNVDYNLQLIGDTVEQLENLKFCSCSEQDCCCGEKNVQEWTWDESLDTNNCKLSEHNLAVEFNPGYSNGTTAIRGNKLMEKGRHHFWEIKMVTIIYGTDVMVGVGTAKAKLNVRGEFCSLLGSDKESWGFSYKGYLQHKGIFFSYSSSFDQDSLVGVHLDTWRGKLQFFLDRKPLGIAFTGLREAVLYPMVCSTAAKTKMRITYSCSVPASLQMECLPMLTPFHKAYLSTAFPGIRYILESIFADILQRHFDDDDDDEDDFEFPAQFPILDEYDAALVGRRKKKKNN